jgi:hypothetical protein
MRNTRLQPQRPCWPIWKKRLWRYAFNCTTVSSASPALSSLDHSHHAIESFYPERGSQCVFPNSHRMITFGSQPSTRSFITPSILSDFALPKTPSSARNTPFTQGTRVPEASVYEYRQFVRWKIEVWLTNHFTWMLHPSSNSMPHQRGMHHLLGRSVTLCSHFGHERGAFGFC